MKIPRSRAGLALSVAYVAISVYLVATQGLFGESFIALILGMPWTFVLAYLEFYEFLARFDNIAATYVAVLLPMAFNAVLLYFIGALAEPKRGAGEGENRR